MSIKLAIFDGEGVIYSCKQAVKEFDKEYEKFLRKFNTNLEEQSKIWFELYPLIVRGKISHREADTIIFKKLGIPTSKVNEWLKKDLQINLKFGKLNKNAKQVMVSIRRMGIKIAILSDTVHSLRWRLKLFKKLGLVKGRHYDKLFLSSMIGFVKPEKEAYLTVLNCFKNRSDEAVFVGHDKEEIEGAKRLGMKTISHRGYRKADFYVKNLNELLKVFQENFSSFVHSNCAMINNLELLNKSKNVYVDTSASALLVKSGPEIYKKFETPENLLKFCVKKLGIEKCIWGSDSPFNIGYNVDGFMKEIEYLFRSGLSPHDVVTISRTNVRRLLDE